MKAIKFVEKAVELNPSKADAYLAKSYFLSSLYLLNRDKQNLGPNFPIQPKGLFKQLRKVLPKNSRVLRNKKPRKTSEKRRKTPEKRSKTSEIVAPAPEKGSMCDSWRPIES